MKSKGGSEDTDGSFELLRYAPVPWFVRFLRFLDEGTKRSLWKVFLYKGRLRSILASAVCFVWSNPEKSPRNATLYNCVCNDNNI